MPDKTYRLIILGAGFSKPAGLPLAIELFREVRRRVRLLLGADNVLERDLKSYFTYLQKTENFTGSVEGIDVEKFLSYLDVEHYLELEGSDTWSDDGNLTQLLVRQTIGYVLLERTPKKIPELYKRFASQLTTSDWVLTFNYDTLLEQALEVVGHPFRLFPHRFSTVKPGFAEVDYSIPEVVLLKMHGSIDWFDKTSYNEMEKQGIVHKHPIFSPGAAIKSSPIVDGPRHINDPLLQIYRLENPTSFYSANHPSWECSPFLLNPSHSKLLYAKRLIEFWRGWGQGGGLQLGLGIIGYSLPDYDDYARQAIYRISRNYQEYEPDFELGGRKKRPIRILDYRPSESEKSNLRKRYQFLNTERTEFWYEGISSEGIDWFMS